MNLRRCKPRLSCCGHVLGWTSSLLFIFNFLEPSTFLGWQTSICLCAKHIFLFQSSEWLYFYKTSGEQHVVGPRDLQVSELAHSSLRLTWSQATGDVTGYRLLVTPLSSRGQLLLNQQRQVRDGQDAGVHLPFLSFLLSFIVLSLPFILSSFITSIFFLPFFFPSSLTYYVFRLIIIRIIICILIKFLCFKIWKRIENVVKFWNLK